MDEPRLSDRSQEPSDADLEQLLGRAKRHWDNLIREATKANPATQATWKFYTPNSGWVLVVRNKKRNVLYMLPIDRRRFQVSFAFRDHHIKALEQSELPADVVAEIRNSKQYPEGRMARVDVATAAEYRIAKRLLEIKQTPDESVGGK